MPHPSAEIHFEHSETALTAVRVTRAARSPVVVSLQRALFALGIVVSAYQVRPVDGKLVERLEFSRSDGGEVDGKLMEATKAAILPIALG